MTILYPPMVMMMLGVSGRGAPEALPVRAYLVNPAQVQPGFLRSLVVERGANALVLELTDGVSRKRHVAVQRAATRAGLPVYGWIEVGRNRAMADAHPEWMASQGSHVDWRRRFPNARSVDSGKVAKVYPWVPIWSKPAYRAHLARIERLLASAPPDLAGLYLNDIQGGPSCCGCGNDQCRWTLNYNVPATAEVHKNASTPLRFVAQVQARFGANPVVPVWCIECESVDQAASSPSSGYCGSVGCFKGACWREYTRQLMPLAGRFDLAVPLLTSPFRRDRADLYPKNGWIAAALRTFQEILPEHGGQAIPTERLTVVLQGWDKSTAEQTTQIRQVERSGAKGYIMALTPIEQSWEPRIIDAPALTP